MRFLYLCKAHHRLEYILNDNIGGVYWKILAIPTHGKKLNAGGYQSECNGNQKSDVQ